MQHISSEGDQLWCVWLTWQILMLINMCLCDIAKTAHILKIQLSSNQSLSSTTLQMHEMNRCLTANPWILHQFHSYDWHNMCNLYSLLNNLMSKSQLLIAICSQRESIMQTCAMTSAKILIKGEFCAWNACIGLKSFYNNLSTCTIKRTRKMHSCTIQIQETQLIEL